MTGWRENLDPTPSQLVGQRLMNQGCEGAVCPSTIEPHSANLVIFLRNVSLEHALHVVGGS